MNSALSPALIFFDDQLASGHDSSIERCRLALRFRDLEVIEAPHIAAVKVALSSPSHQVRGFVIDLHVPQMRGVTNFRDLGLPQVSVDHYWCGAQLIEILSADVYQAHRDTWENGLLKPFASLPFLILSTNQYGHEACLHNKIPDDTPSFWKDVPGDRLEVGVRDWVYKHVMLPHAVATGASEGMP